MDTNQNTSMLQHFQHTSSDYLLPRLQEAFLNAADFQAVDIGEVGSGHSHPAQKQ